MSEKTLVFLTIAAYTFYISFINYGRTVLGKLSAFLMQISSMGVLARSFSCGSYKINVNKKHNNYFCVKPPKLDILAE
jgi:hypothetical protein